MTPGLRSTAAVFAPKVQSRTRIFSVAQKLAMIPTRELRSLLVPKDATIPSGTTLPRRFSACGLRNKKLRRPILRILVATHRAPRASYHTARSVQRAFIIRVAPDRRPRHRILLVLAVVLHAAPERHHRNRSVKRTTFISIETHQTHTSRFGVRSIPILFTRDKRSRSNDARNGRGRWHAAPRPYMVHCLRDHLLADSFDIGWKVGAVLAGYGGPALLQSYETERRPVAARSIEHASVHWTVHTTVWEWSAKGPIISQAEDGKRLRAWVADFLQQHDGENKDLGIELGHRYTDSPVIVADDGEEPVWAKSHYVPSTWPGPRAPHVFLKDGKTIIFDLFGTEREYSLVGFT